MQSILRTAVRARPSQAFALRSSTFRATSIRTLVTKRYTTDHEVVAFDDATGIGIVSITDYAQSSLGDVVFVELPGLGTEVGQGGKFCRQATFGIPSLTSMLDQIGAVESVKAASDIYAPVSGTIEEINETLSSEPSLLNKSPEDKGWLCRIKLSEPSELDSLLTAEAYKEHCES